MDKSENWVERLKISQEQLEAWKSEAPEELPLLVWCLKEGKISFPDYASWAKNFYQMPVLHHDFFSKFDSPALTGKDRWSPWMVPLSHWEGLTYVGCVVPPPDPEENLVYLIADPKDLEEVYAQMESDTAVTQVTQVGAPEMPEGLMLDMKLSQESPPDGLNLNLGIEPPPPPPPQEENEEVSEEVPEAPQGLSLSLDIPSAPPTEEATVPEETLPKEEPASTGLPPEEWWKECQTLFTQAVLLEGSDQEVRVKWFNGKAFEAEPLSCSTPNIFRIVLRTKKPYHGFVVENEIHTQFFKSLGLEKYPAVVSALLAQDEPTKHILVLYGFTGEENEQLEKAEALCQQLSACFSAPPQLNAA